MAQMAGRQFDIAKLVLTCDALQRAFQSKLSAEQRLETARQQVASGALALMELIRALGPTKCQDLLESQQMRKRLADPAMREEIAAIISVEFGYESCREIAIGIADKRGVLDELACLLNKRAEELVGTA